MHVSRSLGLDTDMLKKITRLYYSMDIFKVSKFVCHIILKRYSQLFFLVLFNRKKNVELINIY